MKRKINNIKEKAMSKIKIICTSSGCIEYAPERYRELGIDVLRLHIYFKGKEYLEGLDLDPDKFYSELETLEDPKTTCQKHPCHHLW